MKQTFGTQEVVEGLVASISRSDTTLSQKHLLRESLRALVRLAKSEQIVEMKANVRKLTGEVSIPAARRRAKMALLAHRMAQGSSPTPQQLEFFGE